MIVDCSAQTNWVTNGTVNTTALSSDGSTLYLGGAFTRVGRRTGSFVAVEAATGVVHLQPIFNGAVKAQIPDGVGGWYLGGSFTTVNGVVRKHLVRLLADGSIDQAFAPAPSFSVDALALSGGTLFVGGDFTEIGGSPIANVAAIDAGTGRARTWSVAINAPVRHLAVGGTSLYMAGGFGAVNGQSRNLLAAVDIETAAVKAWNPAPSYGTGLASVSAIKTIGSAVLVAGDFAVIGGQSRQGVAMLDGLTGAATAWDAQINPSTGAATVTTMAIDGSTLYIGGSFNTVAGQPRTSVAALSLATGTVLPWNPNLALDQYGAPYINALTVNASAVFVAGNFLSVDNQSVPGLAQLSKSTGVGGSWGQGTGGEVRNLTSVGDRIWVGGDFALFDGELRNHAAALNTATGVLTGWNPNATSTNYCVESCVGSLLVYGQTVYVAGYFDHVGAAARTGLAAVDATTGSVLPWNPQIVGYVTSMSASAGVLYVGGGYLTSVDGLARQGLAAFDIASGAIRPWAPAARADDISSLLALDGQVLVGGRFSIIAGQTRNGLAAFHSVSGDLLPWNANIAQPPSLPPTVSAMVLLDGALYIQGSFERVAGQVRMGSAALNVGTAALLPWDPPWGGARSLAVLGDTVYAGVAGGVVSANASTGLISDFRFDADGWVSTISVSPAMLYFGGRFRNVGNTVQPNLSFIPR